MADEIQAELLSVAQVLELEKDSGGSLLSRPIFKGEESGRYTGARLAPGVKRAALILLREGWGPQEVAADLGIHYYTVQSLQAGEPEIVAAGKKETARLAGNVGRRALEKINTFIESAEIETWSDAQRAAMVAGITLDKAQVLDGEPTAIIQTNQPQLVDAGAFLSGLLSGPITAQENNLSKEAGGPGAGAIDVHEVAAVAAMPGGAIIAASRRVVVSKAEGKAEDILQAVDCQAVDMDKQLITSQGGADSGAVDGAAAGAGSAAVPACGAGAGDAAGGAEGGGGGAQSAGLHT